MEPGVRVEAGGVYDQLGPLSLKGLAQCKGTAIAPLSDVIQAERSRTHARTPGVHNEGKWNQVGSLVVDMTATPSLEPNGKSQLEHKRYEDKCLIMYGVRVRVRARV
jgi:hypothetical protein